ncbi:hypothetical protein GJU43_18005 [Flavobacterium sp. LC2016-23]|uniref:hypothetical protein n=1 Tax=Flavobacterium sp. LC2016-23 TaxID=2666330 RepID=UPI0012AF028A|nr:hypothetical protein [Flavobacterium sp. LC2016-23]MRX41184.1 hypothetical protein [Flavobacterium sp. LC2016-23]
MKIISRELILIVLFTCCLHVKGQSSADTIYEDNSISQKLYTKCFENLNQGSIIFEKYPQFKRTNLCSLMYCMMLLSFPEKDIQLAGEDLLRGIAIQLYREGNPVRMINGMESYTKAMRENENIEDDNHLVYISYADCSSPYFLSRAADVINKETSRLLNQNK